MRKAAAAAAVLACISVSALLLGGGAANASYPPTPPTSAAATTPPVSPDPTSSAPPAADSSTPVTSAPATPTSEPSTPVPSEGSASVANTSVEAGQSVTVTASGYLSGETVSFYLHSTPVFVGTSRATTGGQASLTFTIPDGFTGEHYIVGTGETSGVVSSVTLHIPAAASAAQSIGEAHGLAFTGTASLTLLSVATVLVAAGVVFLFAGRRKPKHVPRHAGGDAVTMKKNAGELTRAWWLSQATGIAS
ncbi:MAG TPA: hypothetical protein VGL26_09085 [Jatrophihabitans sp.]